MDFWLEIDCCRLICSRSFLTWSGYCFVNQSSRWSINHSINQPIIQQWINHLSRLSIFCEFLWCVYYQQYARRQSFPLPIQSTSSSFSPNFKWKSNVMLFKLHRVGFFQFNKLHLLFLDRKILAWKGEVWIHRLEIFFTERRPGFLSSSLFEWNSVRFELQIRFALAEAISNELKNLELAVLICQ